MRYHPPLWHDRREAGRELGKRLVGEGPWPDPVVLGLPRGGVVVAAEVAAALRAPLDALVVRKVGVPWQPELALGAVGPGGVRVLVERVADDTHLPMESMERAFAAAESEVARREKLLRGGRPPPDLTGRTAIVVDDGLATGATARAALAVVRAAEAGRVVLAVPVAPPQTLRSLTGPQGADQTVALATPRYFGAVGGWYRDFDQVEDDEVVRLLRRSEEP